MPTLKGTYQGKSQSGKAYKVDNQWIAVSQMTNVKIEGDTITAEIPEWLHDKLSKEKKKNPNKFKKYNIKSLNDEENDEPVQTYDNCKKCNKRGFINRQKLCLCCILDLANGNTEEERMASNKRILARIEKKKTEELTKWKKQLQDTGGKSYGNR